MPPYEGPAFLMVPGGYSSIGVHASGSPTIGERYMGATGVRVQLYWFRTPGVPDQCPHRTGSHLWNRSTSGTVPSGAR